MTKVKFLYERDENTVFAFFPEQKYNDEPGLFTCYAHIGQHSSCHIDYAEACKEAPINQCLDLLTELVNYGDGKQYHE